MDLINLASSLVSLILGGFAIWLSIYMYTKTKDSEKEAAKTLEGIKAQTDALQKLTGRWMDRLTRYATEPRPADEGLKMLVSSMANLPTTILTHLRIQSSSGPSASNELLLNDLVGCYIGLYFYTAVANVSAQALLPVDFDESITEHANVKRIVDQSYADFDYMARVILQVDQSRLNSHVYSRLLQEAKNTWRPFVRDTQTTLALRTSR